MKLLTKLFPKIFKRVITIEFSLGGFQEISKVAMTMQNGDTLLVTDIEGKEILFKINDKK